MINWASEGEANTIKFSKNRRKHLRLCQIKNNDLKLAGNFLILLLLNDPLEEEKNERESFSPVFIVVSARTGDKCGINSHRIRFLGQRFIHLKKRITASY